jgi:NAD-dependent deacetylase
VTTITLTPAQTRDLDELAEIIRFHAPLAAFTGAGISTESGIPDYRGPQGLWTTGSAKPFTYDDFMADPDVRRQWWKHLPERLAEAEARQPNAGHYALVRIERAYVMLATITQNIDALHQDAGSDPERVIELHGNNRTIRCTQCGNVYPTVDFLDLVPTLDDPPPCPNCGGILKSGTIAFGQPLPQNDLRVAMAVAQQSGVMLVVGSTLLVNPAARIPAIAREAGAYLAILNKGETALDTAADLKVDAPAGDALTYLADRLLSSAP